MKKMYLKPMRMFIALIFALFMPDLCWAQDSETTVDTYTVVGSSAEIFGSEWDTTNENNKMEWSDGEEAYVKTYTVDQSFRGVALKVVKNGQNWYGDYYGDNVVFNLRGAGQFKVTLSPKDNLVKVVGDIVAFCDTVTVAGNGVGNWLNGIEWDPAAEKNHMTEVENGVWEITFTNVPASEDLQMKFALDGSWDNNFGGTFTQSGEATDAVYNSDNNIKFSTLFESNITARLDLRNFDISTKEGALFTITITYCDNYIVAGAPAEIFGSEWSVSDVNNKMEWSDADGAYVKTYTVDKAYEDVELKVVYNGEVWYGQDYQNIKFALADAGDFKVLFYTTDNVVKVVGDIVRLPSVLYYETVTAVGNGAENWLNDVVWDPSAEQNKMEEVADDVWSITFENVPEGMDNQVKFAIDGSWTINFGGVFTESGVESDAIYDGDNISFDTESDSKVTLVLDLSEFNYISKEGAKFTITIIENSDAVSTSIDNARLSEQQNGNIYNLNGQKVSNPQKGIYIVGGKKVVKK